MARTFYIFRHALTAKGFFGYGDKVLSADILPNAIPPIKKMAEFLKNIPTDFNVCSKIKRCRQTAAIVSEITNKQFVFDNRLNEFYQESFWQLRDRVKEFIIDISKTPHQNILICTHGLVIAALKNLILKNKFGIFQIFDYPKPGKLIIIKEGKIEEVNFN